MFTLTLGTLSLEDYLTDFTITKAKIKDPEAFECFDGTTIGGNKGETVTLDIRLKKVPLKIYESISSVILADTFPVQYTSSAEKTSFKKVKESAQSRSKGLEWDITLILESAAPVGGSCL